mmetsp:Transcript_22369/g.35806  ORF Transcript_22369/g.35806 Transcript_22369/m.35806 type:complete len:323 (-) Transcript_22369:1155-2123(-)
MRPAFVTLTPLEVPVGGRGTALPFRQLIGVHRKAHGAASKPPFETGLFENVGQALFFGLGTDKARARNDHGPFDFDLFAFEDLGCCPQVFDPAIGAGPDKDGVDLDFRQWRAGRQTHIVKRALGRANLAALKVLSRWYNGSYRQHVFGRGAPGHHGRDVFTFDRDHLIPMGIIVGIKGLPPCDRGLPLGTLGRVGSTHAIFIRGFIRGNQASTCAALNGHVADGHAPFHGQAADRFATILDDIAGAAGGAGFSDDGQGDVLGGHTGAQLAGDLDLHVLGFLLDQGLSGQNMLNLGCADAVGQRTECTMGRGMGVATDDGHAG